mmetsp:Transcript_16239/g.50924  ORF Transcript_16239/g.50924 Transcript_16239/m.50924 type:complete len:82 (+) Transcript_16239:41-286(+)
MEPWVDTRRRDGKALRRTSACRVDAHDDALRRRLARRLPLRLVSSDEEMPEGDNRDVTLPHAREHPERGLVPRPPTARPGA